MSDTKPVEIAAEQLKSVGGGSNFTCEDYLTVIGRLTEAYEGLVDFTSHVIERVATATK
jgi:hypothetical protein